MSSVNQVPMIGPDGSKGMVDADKVDSARLQQWEPLIHMNDPNGKDVLVQESKVSGARQQKYSVAQSDSTSKMVTPEGHVTYALPSEVKAFQESGHTLIHPNGDYQVNPLPGEDPQVTVERSKNVVKALGEEAQNNAMRAEYDFNKKPSTIAKSLSAGPVIAAAQIGIPTALGAVSGITTAPTAAAPFGQTIGQVVKEGAKYAIKKFAEHKVATAGGTLAAGYWLHKLFGK